jgi:hypothetical protein
MTTDRSDVTQPTPDIYLTAAMAHTRIYARGIRAPETLTYLWTTLAEDPPFRAAIDAARSVDAKAVLAWLRKDLVERPMPGFVYLQLVDRI